MQGARISLFGWILVAAAVAGVFFAVRWSEQPPPPLSSEAAADRFSAERARVHLESLAGGIGPRVTGTETNAFAAEYLLARLREIPGARIDVQEITGVRRGHGRASIYTVRNIVARLDGTSPGAVLVSTHYDTNEAGPGAGDAAAPVAAMLEVLRALASAEALTRPVIFLFNDGEELGLFGAHAFLRHAWAAEVRTFINVESAGPAGKPVVFQTGPGDAWLARTWARAVPHPYGSALAQDVFQSGAIPSDTDFRIYRDDGGLRGIDFALFREGWLYHTPRDVPAAVSSGSLQALGDNTLAAVRAFASMETFPAADPEPAVYYDVLGLTMLAYDRSVAFILAAVLVVVAAILVLVIVRRRGIGVKPLAAGIVFALLARFLPAAAGALAGAIGPGLGQRMRWFSNPEPAIAAWIAFALAVLVLMSALATRSLRRTDPVRRRSALAIGAVIVFAVQLVIMTALGFGAAYLGTWGLTASILALAAVAFLGTAGVVLAWIALLAPLALYLAASRMLLDAFIPISGRMLLAIPFDPVIAVLAVAPVAMIGPLALVAMDPLAGKRVAAATLVGFGAVALTISLLQFPFAPSRPQRIELEHEISAEGERIVADFQDQLGVRAPYRRLFPGEVSRVDRTRFASPVAAPGAATPALRSNLFTAPEGDRLVVDLTDAGWEEAIVRVPAERLGSWTLWTPAERLDGSEPRVRLVNTRGILEIHLQDGAAAEVAVSLRSQERSTELARTIAALPSWAAGHGAVLRTVIIPIERHRQ